MRLALPSTCLLLSTCCGSALAQEIFEPPVVTVIAAPGGAIDRDDGLALGSGDIDRAGQPDLLSALARTVAGISLQDAQGNPWQPNLVYRGFTASPLQGQAQGLAAYLDGGRFNQPFGDTVGFDLIPEVALRRVDVLDASPVYGLNGLGGAILLTTHDGRSAPGIEAALSAGAYGEREGSVSAGGSKGAISWYVAGQHRREDGWRDFSPSRLTNGLADVGFDTAGGGLHLKLLGADTDLTGNGVAPVELLAARRKSVLSWPDRSKSQFQRASLHPWVALSERTRIEATLYAQDLKLKTVNGDIADIEPCDDDEALLCLEAGDDEAFLTDAGGQAIATPAGDGAFGVLNRGEAQTRAMGVLVQIADRRPFGEGENHLIVGASFDTSRTRFGTSVELGVLTPNRSVEGLGPRIVQSDGAVGPVGVISHTRYWGLFAQNLLPLTSRLSAEIGLRYNHARVRLDDRIGTALNGEHVYARVNPGLELDWQVRPSLALRAGYAENSRNPTPAELSCADENAPCSLANFFVADPHLRQVVARTWEIGASGRGRLAGWQASWLLSGYRTTNTDDIQHIASRIRGRAYFQNIGRTRRQGAELTTRASKGGWQVSASYAFTDARFLDPLVLSSPSNPFAAADGTINVRPGDRLPGIARHGLSLAADYAGKGWSLGADMIVRSGVRLVGDEANEVPEVPGYAVFNARAALQIVRGVSLFGEVRNLFDRKYATFGTFAEIDEVYLAEAPDAQDPRALGPAAPRRWSVGVKAAF